MNHRVKTFQDFYLHKIFLSKEREGKIKMEPGEYVQTNIDANQFADDTEIYTQAPSHGNKSQLKINI